MATLARRGDWLRTFNEVLRRERHACVAPRIAPGVRSMSDPFKEFVEEMARLTVPEDDTEESRGRRETAAFELGTPICELDEFDIVACADDEFLCSEALTLWAMIRKARELIGQAQLLQRIQTNRAAINRISASGGERKGDPSRRVSASARTEERPVARLRASGGASPGGSGSAADLTLNQCVVPCWEWRVLS